MLLDYQATSWGRRAFWLLVGVAVPVTLWMLRGNDRGQAEREPVQKDEVPVAPASPSPEPPAGAKAPGPEPQLEPSEPVTATPEPESSEAVDPTPEPEASDSLAPAPEDKPVETRQASPIWLEIVDSKDIGHSAQLIALDRKQAKVTCDDTLAVKEKVKLRVPTDAGTLTLGATLESLEGNLWTLKLMRLDAGLRKRLDAFLEKS